MADPVKYNQARQRLQELIPLAAQIDGTIQYLSSELAKLKYREEVLIPEMPSFGENVPSISEEEKEETSEIDEFDRTIYTSIGDFIRRMADPVEFKEMKETLVPVLEREIPKAIQAILDSPEVNEKTKRKVSKSAKNYMQVSETLDRLHSFLQQGFIKQRITDPRAVTEFESIADKVKQYLGKSNITSLPEGIDFEDILMMNPLLLGRIVGSILKTETTQTFPGGKGRPVSPPGETTPENMIEHLEYERQKTQKIPSFDNLDPEIQKFLHRHDIYSRDDFLALAEWFNKTIVNPVKNDILYTPESYGAEKIPGLSNSEQECVSLNQAASNYSIYQLHANQAFITALLKKIRRKEEIENSSELLREVLKICFPQQLVNSVRECMKKTFPADYEMLQSRTISDPNPKQRSNVIFIQMPSTYSDTIDAMMNLLSFTEESPYYFPFAGRQSLGRLFSLSYGGGYKDINKKQARGVERYEAMTYPGFGDRPVILDSFSDINMPFWGHPLPKMIGRMQSIETQFVNSIRNFILYLEKTGKLDEDDVLKAFFYLAYILTSSNLIRQKKLFPEKTSEEDWMIFADWMETYYELVLADDNSRMASHSYVFPAKFLFSQKLYN